jgi:DNA adenine methylase
MIKDWKKNWKEEFEYSRSKIGGSTIENLDFEELIDRYGPRKGDFWYLDPPYFVAHEKGNKYYQHNFNHEDHLRLKEKVDMIHNNGGKFMVSYDYREEVKEMYKDYDVRTIDLKYAGATDEAKQKERKEYLIINYEPVNQIGLF